MFDCQTLTNKRFSLRSIIVKNDSDIINAGFKCFAEFDESDYLIPHFIICTYTRIFTPQSHKKTSKQLIRLKMRENGVRSVILTILNFRRRYLREGKIWMVWVAAKSQSFPPTRFSIRHIFLGSDTHVHAHVQTQSQV